MSLHSLAGKLPPPELIVDVARLERDYYELRPDPKQRGEAVSFGTSGHRGTSSNRTFNEAHILAITQGVCDYRRGAGISGPLYLGMDTHALSLAAQRTALEVLAANGVDVFLQRDHGFTPTPAISHAILSYNRGRSTGLADGLILTPSHNPPIDGGMKYNPPNGGPAEGHITEAIQRRANELLGGGADLRRVPYEQALRASTTHAHDFVGPYVEDLAQVIDLEAIRRAGVRIGVDPLGGAAIGYWEPIRKKYGLDLKVVNTQVDPTFRFMTVDHDGKIRMDCSSPSAMASLIGLKDEFQVAFGNDPDSDRHGIVTPAGLMNPNHYLAVAIDYLAQHRPQWKTSARIGKTVVSSRLIDHVVQRHGRPLYEVPVGFKWFAPGLFDGSLVFGGEESAGASFQRHDGTAWSTDKDGLILGLLAAEITATTGHDPGWHYRRLTADFGTLFYTRIDTAISAEQKDAFKRLSAASVSSKELAGDPILKVLTQAPGNGQAIGGLKVETAKGWFAARPSGTENLYKLYAESAVDATHLEQFVQAARELVTRALHA